MYVVVIHRIHDPAGFKAAEERAMAAGGPPPGFGLPIHAATADHTNGVCIWEAPSVDALKELLEPMTSAYATNEYHAMDVDGLPGAG